MRREKGEARTLESPHHSQPKVKGRQMGGFQTGVFPDLDLSFLSLVFWFLTGKTRQLPRNFCPSSKSLEKTENTKITKSSLQIYQGNPKNQGKEGPGTCPSLFVLFGTFPIFRDFPDLLRESPGIFPIRLFLFLGLVKSTYEEQSRKGPRHNLDLSREKKKTGKLPGLAQHQRKGNNNNSKRHLM